MIVLDNKESEGGILKKLIVKILVIKIVGMSYSKRAEV